MLRAQTTAQTLLYMDLGLWLLVLNGLSGNELSATGLGLIFSAKSISVSYTGGWVVIVAFFINALAGCMLSSLPLIAADPMS